MKVFYSIIAMFLLFSCTSCTDATLVPSLDFANVATNLDSIPNRHSRIQISPYAQVFALEAIEAPAGYSQVVETSDEWSFYLVRFNLQLLPLNKEEVKATYFGVTFSDSSKKDSQFIVERLFPNSLERIVYSVGGQVKGGGGVSGSVGVGRARLNADQPISTDSDDQRVAESIVDLGVNPRAGANAYFSADMSFSARIKKEKREPLLTATGTLSDSAIWLDRRPFKNGDQYYSVVLKIHRRDMELAIRKGLESKSDAFANWVTLHKRAGERAQQLVRMARSPLIKAAVRNESFTLLTELSDSLSDQIKKLSEKVESEENIQSIHSNVDGRNGFLVTATALKARLGSFAEAYQAMLDKILNSDAEMGFENRFALEFQQASFKKLYDEINLLIYSAEYDLYSVKVDAEAWVNVSKGNGDKEDIQEKIFSEAVIGLMPPEGVIGLVEQTSSHLADSGPLSDGDDATEQGGGPTEVQGDEVDEGGNSSKDAVNQ